jgi:hypothetical protein
VRQQIGVDDYRSKRKPIEEPDQQVVVLFIDQLRHTFIRTLITRLHTWRAGGRIIGDHHTGSVTDSFDHV